MEKREIYLLGIGHGTPIFMELAEACGYTIAGLYHYNDERTGEIDHGYKILGSFEDLFRSDIKGKLFCLTMGDMNTKTLVSKRLMAMGGGIPTLIHPTAIVSTYANISDCGVLVCSHCEIHNDSNIEEGCVMWPQAMVGHDCYVGEYTFFGPKSYLGAYTEVEPKVFIGQCSVIISGKVQHIGTEALIGAGSVVTKAVPKKAVVAGNPAKILKYKN